MLMNDVPLWMNGILTAICIFTLGWSLLVAPWRQIKQEQGLQHLLFGALLVMVLVWSIRAELTPGLSIHFWGMATVALVFGFDLALILGAIALLAITTLGQQPWQLLSLNIASHVLLPIVLTLQLRCIIEAVWGKNFFLYLFGCGFIGGGVVAFLGGLLAASLLALGGLISWATVTHEYVMYFPLLLFFEGFINGVLMTGMMVFHPDWIRSFDAQGYIDQQ